MALPPEGKLVRDLIPQIVEESGGYCEPLTLDDEDMWEALYHKMLEEACELVSAPTAEYRLSELADVYEVLRTQAKISGIPMKDVVSEATRKRYERGGFTEKQWVSKFYTRQGDAHTE